MCGRFAPLDNCRCYCGPYTDCTQPLHDVLTQSAWSLCPRWQFHPAATEVPIPERTQSLHLPLTQKQWPLCPLPSTAAAPLPPPLPLPQRCANLALKRCGRFSPLDNCRCYRSPYTDCTQPLHDLLTQYAWPLCPRCKEVIRRDCLDPFPP